MKTILTLLTLALLAPCAWATDLTLTIDADPEADQYFYRVLHDTAQTVTDANGTVTGAEVVKEVYVPITEVTSQVTIDGDSVVFPAITLPDDGSDYEIEIGHGNEFQIRWREGQAIRHNSARTGVAVVDPSGVGLQ